MSGKETGIPRKCPFCDGSGRAPGPVGLQKTPPCPVCKGAGSNLIPPEYNRCPSCDGYGTQYFDSGGTEIFVRICTGCRGTGWAE